MEDSGYNLLPPQFLTATAAKGITTLIDIPTTISVSQVLFVVKNTSAAGTACLVNGSASVLAPALPETWLLTTAPAEKQQFGPFNINAKPFNLLRASTDVADVNVTVRVFFK